ncbi:hypothetical protein [Streptomyces sp. Inha503]|uniref:hypothetical protein n=1 Tax=Streptomyces sp. Inha503 TaxID=3383314 RepID=UPI00399F305B
MKQHELPATRDTVVNVFDRGTSPVTVGSGDSVVAGSLDAAEYLEPMKRPGHQRPRMFEGHTGHRLTGPIEVPGAEPGMPLKVRFESIRADSWRWTLGGVKGSTLTRRLDVADGPES